MDVPQALESLQEIIARVIADLETGATLHQVREALGLPYIEELESLGKRKYLHKVTVAASDQIVICAAQQIMNAYPGNREKPQASDVQSIQDALWWIESEGIQQISNVTRYQIAESLEGVCFWGRFSLRELFAPVLPTEASNSYFTSVNLGNDGYLSEGQFPPSRITVLDYLRRLGLEDWPDQRFCRVIERLVHPEVQSGDIQKQLVTQFNVILQREGFELREEGVQGGLPVYKVRRNRAGVAGLPKYIIFASTGPKPEIIFGDALNMDISIVRHADQCLVYDQPPPSGDLTWQMLVQWWSTKAGNGDDTDLRGQLGRRLQASLQSEPERLLFSTYFREFKPRLGDRLPALLPQVYLHYDPRSRSERDEPVLVRQRMDFLLLLRNAARIVIEIDGVQHYADESGRASTQRYAKMVAEDRRIRTLGYEVYRFGGAEFVDRESASKTVIAFFEELFARHEVRPELKI
jgi:very-short-patch-repair endonuclease